MIYAVLIHILCFINFILGNEGGRLIMNVLWRSLARMSAKLIFLLSVAGCFGTLAYASEGIITTVAGKIDIDPVNDDISTFFSGDGGLAINAQLNQPEDVAVDNRGNIYIVDWGNSRIRKVDIAGNISTIAGSDDWRATDWLSNGSSNSATSISIGLPSSIIVNDKDEVYISDEDNHRIYQILIDGTINVIAGSGTTDGGFSGDGGLAIHAQLGYPSGLAIDNNGNLYVADSRNHRVRKIDTSGIISTVAGNGSEGFSGDGGLAINAQLDWPNDIAFDKNGNLYIADSGNNRVRKVDLTSNTISTVAGNGATDGIIDTWDGEDTGGFSGDGGLAIHAQFNYPTSIAFDKDNNLYISDLFNNRIRRVDTAGTIMTVAGSNINQEDTEFNGDEGKATEAKLLKPKGITIDNNNNLFIADMGADRVRKVTFSNSTVNQECREVLTEVTTSEGITEITRETYCKGEDGKWHFLNLSPTADFYISPSSSGQAPLTINLDAIPSSDSDGFIISYQWLVNGQILTGKIVSVTLEKAGNYPITLTVADDKGATNTKTNAITVTQPSNAFCTSGSANVNNLNCVNGNCSGIKISCNSKSCQWCDGSNNCGNILYDGTTSIPNGSITCNKGRCNYKTQIGGSSSSGSFGCKTSEIPEKVEAINPIVSQPIYQNGDTIKITIPATAPADQTQYFGVGLPDNLGLFLADDLNQFHPFDGINLLAWKGGETAVEVPVTQDLPRGTYNAYLLRSLKGINPLTATANQTALGKTDFVVMDEIKVTQVTDPNTELAFVGTTGKETVSILGDKDKDGRLTKVKRIYLASQANQTQNLSISLDDNYLPETMEFPDGSQIEFHNYTDTGATATFRDASGQVAKQAFIPLQIDDLYEAAAAIKQYQELPQPTRDNPVPSAIGVGNIGYPTDSNCLEVMSAVHKGVEILFHGLSQMVSTVSCIVATTEAALSGGIAVPLATWACSSIWLNTADKVKNLETGGKSPIKQFTQANNLLQQISSCFRKDWIGCSQPIGDAMGSGLLDYLKPENVCKEDTTTSNIDVGKIDFGGTDCKFSITNFKASSDDGKNYNVSFDFEDQSELISNQYMQISFTASCDLETGLTVPRSDTATLVFSGEEHGHKETTISTYEKTFSCIAINGPGSCGKYVPLTLTQPQPNCVSSVTYDQWCRDNGGFNFDYGICLAHFGSKEKMLEGLKQCEAFGGRGKDEALNRITCNVTLCE